MIKFLIISILLFGKNSFTQDFKLVCMEVDSSYNIGLSSSFSKIINFKDQTLTNYSGAYFDKVILFGKDEVIVKNKMFNTRSTFNIFTNMWTTYKDNQFVKIYDCVKNKRRF